LFALWKDDHPLFVTSNRCVPVKNVLGWSAVVFFVCVKENNFSAVLCVVIAMHKFDFRFVIKETPNGDH
jgi:hypothetical protein